MNWRHARFNLIEWTVLPLGILLLKAIVATYRIDEESRETVRRLMEFPRLFAVTLHGMSLGLLPINHIVRTHNRQLVVMTSPSRDGRLMDKIVGSFGIAVVKGSSRSKSIEGARGMIEAVLDGNIALLTPDGPRGPIFQPKRGFIRMVPASQSHLTIVAVGAKHALTFGSWDRLFLPLPFSRIRFVEKQFVYTDPEPGDEAGLLQRMEREMIAVARSVDCPITRPYDSNGNPLP